MNIIDKAVFGDITLGQLLDGLAAAPEAPLVFLYEGQPVKAGYYVTERPLQIRAPSASPTSTMRITILRRSLAPDRADLVRKTEAAHWQP